MTPGPQFLARLASLVPPPRHPLVRYVGVLSSASRWREHVAEPRFSTSWAIASDYLLVNDWSLERNDFFVALSLTSGERHELRLASNELECLAASNDTLYAVTRDAVFFRADVPHTYRTVGAKPFRGLSLILYGS